jgi:hypothetical protein
MKHVSIKAQAWELVALWADQAAPGDFDVDPLVREHILKHVVPSLKRKAEIVERNSKRRGRGND